MKESIIQTVKELVGNEFLYFSTSLLIKITPVQIWAICVSHKDEIFLMDGHEQWHQLEETDKNYEQVLSTLYQRVKTISKYFKTVA